MGLYPCMSCNKRFPGEARNVYLSLYRGPRRLKLRFIVCAECEDEFLAPWVARALYRQADGQWSQWVEGLGEDALWSLQEDPQSFRNVWNAWSVTPRKE